MELETEIIVDEFSALVEWLQTFNLQTETSTPSDLSAGVSLSEALVNIEPSFFTPSWFAGILHSVNDAKQNLNSVLNLMLHYYRQNLEEVTASGSLEIPDLSAEIDENTIARFLKLMLGIAVTCSNRQTFIGKIQSLNPGIQHSLTQCVASFIIIKDWGGSGGGAGDDAEGRVSAQSLTSDVKPVTPPGDEIWAQKCHELDFQVAILKEERSNLLVENEELYGKVREAQTLSRKDSVKAKQLETEVDHLKDEFDRLRILYESTRDHIDNMEKRIKPEERDTVEILKLKGESAAMKTELATLKASVSRRNSEKSGAFDECQVVQRLQDQQDYIQELRNMMEYQVSIQTSLVREMDCLKDQLDLLREQWHNMSDTSLGEGAGLGAGQLLPSLRSEACLVTATVSSHSQSNLLEHSYTVSHNNLATASKSVFDVRKSEENKLKPLVKVVKKKLSREPGASLVIPSGSGPAETESGGGSDGGGGESEQHIYVNNYDYADFYQVQDTARLVKGPGVGSRKPGNGNAGRDGVYSTESDSGLDVTPETTPYTSRPESELLLNDDKDDKEDVKASPRQLEMMMNESSAALTHRRNDKTHRAVDELIRVISNSNIAISVDEIEALVGAGTNDEDYSQLVEDIPEDKFEMEPSKRPIFPIPLDPAEIQLFDPNDPKVKDLEEWNCSIHDKSLYEEETPKRRLKRLFSLKKKTKPEELKMLTRINSVMRKKSSRTSYTNSESSEYDGDKFKHDNVALECLKSWLLSIFVKLFD